MRELGEVDMTGLKRLRNVANAMRGYAVRGGGPLDLELMGIADLIERETERDPEDDVSMSAYDLLPDDEQRAIAWVRAQACGGGAMKRLAIVLIAAVCAMRREFPTNA